MRLAPVGMTVLVVAGIASAGEPSSERERRVSACAACHPSEYDNWSRGPHANSFRSLERYRDRVLGDPGLHPPDLVESFERGVPEECRGCHAPAGLFGAILEPAAEGSARVFWSRVPPARDATSAGTGVDCLTCHVDEAGRIRRAASGANASGARPAARSTSVPESCGPVGSPALADQTFCFVCHSDTARQYLQVKYVLPRDVRGRMDERGCGGCHQEYREDGSATHYTFWKDGPTEKGMPSRAVFDRVRVTVADSAEAPSARIELANDFSPHEFPSQSLPEFAVRVEVLPGRDVASSSGVFRLNRKSAEDRKYRERGETEKMPGGVVGTILLPFEAGISLDVPLDQVPVAAGCQVTVSVRYKSQYWLPDERAHEIYRKSEPCALAGAARAARGSESSEVQASPR